jgi:hypothetical protein
MLFAMLFILCLEGTMQKPRLLDEVRSTCRVRHHSIRTEKAYIGWIKRYIYFHNKRHPKDMGAAEINAFLSWLAVERKVAAATQNQALNALVFLYHQVLKIDPGDFGDVVRAKNQNACPLFCRAMRLRLFCLIYTVKNG